MQDLVKTEVINDWMLVIDGALDEAVCDSIVQEAESNLKNSGILGEQISKYRTSRDSFLSTGSELNDILDNLIEDWISIPKENFERASVINYLPDQEYKQHYDFLYHIEGETDTAGDRTYTAVFYLNDDFTGGETFFPKLDYAVKPKKGRLVIWKNYIDGFSNFQSLHTGQKVITGEKWIATKWVREKKYIQGET
ncbi:MAG: 2OG-Fe(II) oxygenase [Candidatus Melainabacteria bacterium]|nr:2OG-Fe(II) oxygenase [Candidatus Melainabacteria bacterium]